MKFKKDFLLLIGFVIGLGTIYVCYYLMNKPNPVDDLESIGAQVYLYNITPGESVAALALPSLNHNKKLPTLVVNDLKLIQDNIDKAITQIAFKNNSPSIYVQRDSFNVARLISFPQDFANYDRGEPWGICMWDCSGRSTEVDALQWKGLISIQLISAESKTIPLGNVAHIITAINGQIINSKYLLELSDNFEHKIEGEISANQDLTVAMKQAAIKRAKDFLAATLKNQNRIPSSLHQMEQTEVVVKYILPFFIKLTNIVLEVSHIEIGSNGQKQSKVLGTIPIAVESQFVNFEN
jgi:hypothetical protein